MKIYNYFLVTAVIVMVAFLADSSLRPQYEVYYADPIKFFTWYPALGLLLMWRVCHMSDKFLGSRKLTYTHVLVSSLALGCIYLSPFVHLPPNNGFAGAPRRYFDYERLGMMDISTYFSRPVQISIIVFILAQFVFVANFVLGIGERPNSKA